MKIFVLFCAIILVSEGFTNHFQCRVKVALNAEDSLLMSQEIELSPLIQGISASKTIEIHALTKDMEKEGREVLSLCVGEPDYQPPKVVIDAMHEAASKGLTKYTAVSGMADLREAIVEDLDSRKGLAFSPDQIIVSGGAKQSIMQALLCILKPGDGVIIPSPYWTSYPDMVRICGATPVIVETRAENGYKVLPDSIRESLESNPKIKAVILCNPSNPTGCVMTEEDLKALADVLTDHPSVTVISDEIYEHLTYGVPHTSFAALPGMSGRTVTINGFSKSHSMTGLRIGYAAAPLHVAKACGKLQSQFSSCPSSVGQYAAMKALNSAPASWIPEKVKELESKRDLMYGLLTQIPGLSCPKPDGAFYMLPDISAYFGTKTLSGVNVNTANDFCLALLKEQAVALVPGEAFGADSCVRLSYAASETLIKNSIERVSQFMASLSS